MNGSHSSHIHLKPFDNQRLAKLCGQYHENIKQVAEQLGVQISNRGNHFQISGQEAKVKRASEIIHQLYQDTQTEEFISPERVHLYLRDTELKPMIHDEKAPQPTQEDIAIPTRAGLIRGHTPNQRKYLTNIARYDINFSIGPAGTGKTYLAVASAVAALEHEQVMRIVLVRPAVEAGENLGFLPGGLEQKIEPYLRPLYDALFEMLGFERVNKLIEQNVVEVAPLAYMRGRTLNDAFIILDESQNTTTEQMKMFLTRIGFNSKVIVTGDITQIDLPKAKKSGLIEAKEVLKNIEGICFTYFDSQDVVRHALVQRIVEAYDAYQRASEGKTTETQAQAQDDQDKSA